MHIFRFSGMALVFAAVGWGAAANAGDPPMTKSFIANVAFDAPDANTGDGECNALPDPNGPKLCTLRAAIMQGNTYGENWQVSVLLIPGVTYGLTIAGPNEDISKTGDLDIRRPMRIGVPQGLTSRAKIDANGLDRIFEFHPSEGESALYGLEIVGGEVAGDDYVVAIRAEAEALSIDFSEIHSNHLQGDEIAAAVVQAKGKLTIRNSEIHDNGDPASGSHAVALRGHGSAAELLVDRVTITSNWGDGINVQENAFLFMSESTVSNHTWGGVDVRKSSAVIQNSTIVGNPLDLGIGAVGATYLQLTNSVVSNEPYACFIESSGEVVFHTAYNIYSDLSCGSDTPIDHSLHNTDPQLSELDYWGGVTRTHKPLPGSAAIDRAPALFCSVPGVDQRGFPRPVTYEFGAQPRCDTGAVELSTLPPDEPPPDEPPPDEPPPVDPALPIFADSFEICDGC